MSNKLYPPRIEASLPAFVKDIDKCNLIIPFQLNRAVGRNEFNQVRLNLKTVQSNTLVCENLATNTIDFDNKTGHWKAFFDLSSHKNIDSIIVGQFYKVQIAFAFDNEIGYYSDASLIKCTAVPNIYIKNLDAMSTSNAHTYEYTGIYAPVDDPTEKVYSYHFNLYDENNQLVATSGEQLHNSSIDTDKTESSDTWLVPQNLKPGYWYSLQYTVTTMNNLVVASPAYKILQIETVKFDIGAKLYATMCIDDGYIDLWLKPNPDMHKKVRGSFLLTRASSEDNFNNWQELYRFELVSETPEKHIWQDFTIQQGVDYKYALQAFNDNGLYSNKMENVEGAIKADFEDMFLFDGERQLNIKFNPQVSSFKTTVLESKVDTIGGKYPFIFRSGSANYKEFPIAGLISMLTDTNELFMSDVLPEASSADRPRTAAQNLMVDNLTNLTSDNFYRERLFKLEVLDWLNNGKPKLFRSPGEGNYIVSLMNTSLTPETQLGRMLHKFSTTAYEVAECNYTNLNKYGFIKSLHRNYRVMKISQFLLADLFNPNPASGEVYSFPGGAYFLSIANQYTDALILDFHFANGTIVNWNIQNPTGQFNIPISDSPVLKIVYRSGRIESDATITFGYYDENVTNDFSFITKVTLEDRIEQYIGNGMDINLIDSMQDIRRKLGRFYYIKLAPRYMYDVYTSNGHFYWDDSYLHEITEWDSTALYAVKNANYWLSGDPTKVLEEMPVFRAQFNATDYSDFGRVDRSKDHQTSARFEAIMNVDEVHTLKLGTGMIADIVYQLKTLEYTVETTSATVAVAKEQWQGAEQIYNNAIADGSVTGVALEALKNIKDKEYYEYIQSLENALQAAQEEIIYAI